MIRKLFTSIIALTTLMLWGVVFAQTWNIDVMHLPKLDQYITDFAWVLDTQTLDELNINAYTYEQTSWHQFVAVLIPDRQWYELFDIALNIFNENQIGNKDINDGLLLVISTNEKKIRIMVWYGLEGEMPDVLASKIIEENIRPLVNSWDFAWAVRAFYTRAQEAISSGEWKQMQNKPTTNTDDGFWIYILVAVFAYGFGNRIRQARKKENQKKWANKDVIWIGIFSTVWTIIGMVMLATVFPMIVYAIAGVLWYVLPSRPKGRGPWGWWWWFGGFSSGWGRSSWGWSSFGWFSWGGWFSGGGWAGD